MEFKIGDKVVVKQWDDMVKEFGKYSNGDIHCEQTFSTEMRSICGGHYTISDVDADGRYTLIDERDCKCCWKFTDDMLEKELKFSRDDIKDGMVVKLRNNDVYFVHRGVLVNEFGHKSLDNYDDDLTQYLNPSLDIMAVYSTGYVKCLDDLVKLDNVDMIWERVDKLTLEQICEELGRRVEIVE